MCGIAGCIDARRSMSAQELESTAAAMARAVRHRGPDGHGTWVDPERGVALGHQRLSIVDLSAAGHQPMVSSDGRFVLTFNGEIYDHPRIRRRLAQVGATFRGHSDTEVLLEAIARWGLVPTLEDLDGMFALALWDRSEHRLSLARDRMGEKPLYYGWMGSSFLFGSELKALRAHPDFKGHVDPSSVAAFLRLNCVPGTSSIYEGVAKVGAGELVEIDPSSRECRAVTYWSVADVARRGAHDPLLDADEALTELDALLGDAVARRMVADVPVGAFLSGGVDSALMVALATEQHAGPVNTFTIGFDDAAFDEAPHARAIASHLGTAHTEHYVSPGDALALVPELATMYDEPFADSSQIPTHLLAQITRQHVTVSISGDAGDELFGGYDRYRLFVSLWERMGRLPAPSRRAAAWAIRTRPASWWSKRIDSLAPVLPRTMRPHRAGEKLHKLARVLRTSDEQDAYRVLFSQWQDPTEVVRGASERTTALSDPGAWPDELPLAARPRLVDQLLYLPDDILVKVDRATMAVGLEARVPMLDHRVVELAWRMPPSLLHRDGRGKWPLRALLARRVPVALFDRPKQGFAVPIATWLRGPLREWAEDLLDPRNLDDGLLDTEVIGALWRSHLARDDDWAGAYDLWAVLMLQSWLAENDRPMEPR